MRKYELRTQVLVPRSLQETFAFFEDPANLHQITPPWLALKLASPQVRMGKGAQIDYRIRWCGLPLRWRTLIVEYEPPFFFTDRQIKGPFRFWEHTHRFHPTEEGTLVEDEVLYELPFGCLGRLVHWLIVRRQLESIFRYRRERLRELLGSVPEGWSQPHFRAL